MTLYFDQGGTDRVTLQDIEPSFGTKMGAAVDEDWLESYGPTAVDWVNKKRQQGEPLSAVAAADKIKGSGLAVSLKPKDNEYTDAQLDVILGRQRELTVAKDIRDRTPWDMGSAVRGVAMFGAGIADPVNLATAFVPWTRAVGAARSLEAARLSSSALTRFGGRAGLGAIDAGISTAALEPFYAGMRRSLGDDYDAMDSVANIAFGTAFGGGVLGVGGVGVDAFRQATGRALPSARFKGMSTDDIELVTGLEREIAAGMDARDVARVLETYSPEMRKSMGFPDADATLDVVVPPAGMVTGNDARVKVGEVYEPAQWAVVDADQLTATIDKADNQFRDRNRAAYQAELQTRANNLDPSLLLSVDNPLMDVGTPTIAVDGRIIGGNGRTLFIQRAYEIGKGEDYRAALLAKLTELGIDPAQAEGIKRPVLVRRFTRQVDVKKAAMLSNEGGSTAMSALEQAKVDAERLSNIRLEADADGNFNVAGNRAGIRRWLEAVPDGERNELMSADGMLSSAGLQRLRNASLFRAYGDSPVLERLVESTNVGSRNVASALARTVGVVADAEAGIGRGELYPLSISDDIRIAVEQFENLRQMAMPVDAYLAQQDALGDALTGEARLLLSVLGRHVASSRRIADVISGYYDRVQDLGNPSQADIFGDVMTPDKLRMLQDSIDEMESRMDNAAEVVEKVEPETREAAMRAGIAQMADGRVVDVEAIIKTDPAAGGTATAQDLQSAAARNQAPESLRVADFEASGAIDAENVTAPKWSGVADAQAAMDEADAMLADTLKAGDQAFKYSRGEAPGQKKATVWQGTTARFAAEPNNPLGMFRWDKINSEFGEQAQAFGYGHYLAQQAWVSQTRYRQRLTERRLSQGRSYEVSDGAGGTMILNMITSAKAFTLADGTVVHRDQKNPAMAAKAAAIYQVREFGYEGAERSFRQQIEGYEKTIANETSPSKAAQQRGDLANVRARLRAIYEVTKPNEVIYDETKMEGEFAKSSFYIDNDPINGAAARLYVQNSPFGFGNKDFDSVNEAVQFIRDNAGRTLDPAIKEYVPPVPDDMRTRVIAGGQEITSNLSLYIEREADISSGRVLGETIGLDIKPRTSTIKGVNKVVQLDMLLERLNRDQQADAVASRQSAITELEQLISNGVTEANVEAPGSLYRAEIPEDVFGRMLLWEAPMGEQSPEIQALFEDWGLEPFKPPVWEPIDGGFQIDRGVSGKVAVKELKQPSVQAILDQYGYQIYEAPAGSPDEWAFQFKDGSVSYYSTLTDAESVAIREWEVDSGAEDGRFAFYRQGNLAGNYATLDEAKAAAMDWLGVSDYTGEYAYRWLVDQINSGEYGDELGDPIMEAHYEIATRRFPDVEPIQAMSDYDPSAEEVASIILHNNGVPGHLFFDGQSRAAGQGAYNLVVYADDVAKIVDRYARQTGELLRATDNPADMVQALRLSFGESTETLLDAGRVRIVATPDQIPGGPHPADVKGATAPNGLVYMVASNLSVAEAKGMMLHEVGVHVGMESMLGRELFDEVLSQLDDAILRGEDWAQRARASVPADTAASLVREEQLAYLVQNAPELPIVQRIIAAVRAWAYRTFEAARGRFKLTEADFRALAVSALHAAARAEKVSAEGLSPAFSRDLKQTATRAFREWFGKSELVDAAGDPLVMYHGTAEDLDAVDLGRAGTATDMGNMGTGFYVTPEDFIAETYARMAGGDRVVMPLFVRAENVLKLGTLDENYIAAVTRLTDEWGMAEKPQFDGTKQKNKAWADEFAAAAQARGFDAVAAYTPAGEMFQLAVFREDAVKHATENTGQFSPTDKRLRYSRGETPDNAGENPEMKAADAKVERAKSYAKVLRSAADKLDNDAEAVAAMKSEMPDIMPEEIDDLLGQLRKQVQGLRGVTRSVRDAMGAEDAAAKMQTEAMRAADMLANNLEMAAVIERRNVALNMNVRLKAASFVNQYKSKGLDFEGFAALLVGSQRVRAGARVSVDAEYKGFRGEFLGGMIADIEKLGLMREFVSGVFDRDVYDALWRLGQDKPDLTGLSPQAVQLAEIVNKYQQTARDRRNRFGAWIRDLQGYITRQSHDMFKIREATDAEWVDFVKDKLDLPKMMRLGLISEVDPMGSLRALYDDFAAGVHMKASPLDEDTVAMGKGSNLAKRESVSRALYFKDGVSAFEYNQRFGMGTLAESVVTGLDRSASAVALLKTLGTNPEATLTRLLDEYENSLVSDPVRRAKFRERRGAVMNLLAQVDGSVNIPGDVTAAKISSFARSWMSMAKLGGALISSVSDLAGYAAELRYSEGKNMFEGVLDGMNRLTQGRAKNEKADIVSSLGVFHESVAGSVSARFDNPDLVAGKMAAAMQQFFKLNGLNWWTETLRDGAALQHSHYMALQAGKKFDGLDPELQRLLTLYNIDGKKWDLLRMGTMQMADGRAYMTPEALRTVPRAALENYITEVGRTVSDASVKNLTDDLSQALRVMAVDRAHHAVLEPSARSRAWMLRGSRPGTVQGELLRFIGQFKSFSVAMTQMVLGREVYGRGYDTVGEYIKNGRGDMVGLASMIGMYGALGYAAMAGKDLLKGREPRDPTDPKTIVAALAQGGGLGIYGDFLFGEYSRMGRTFTSSLAGPVIGNLDTLTDLWTRVRNGDDVAAASFKALLDNTPFLNLYWIRPLLDYMVLFRIQESLNPGFLRRMEKRIERENGQSYILPPSQVAF